MEKQRELYLFIFTFASIKKIIYDKEYFSIGYFYTNMY